MLLGLRTAPVFFLFGNQNWHGFVPPPTVTGIKSGLYNCVWSAWEAQQNYQWLSVKRTCEKKTYTLWHWGSDKGSQGWWRNIFYYLGPQVPMKILNLQYMGKNITPKAMKVSRGEPHGSILGKQFFSKHIFFLEICASERWSFLREIHLLFLSYIWWNFFCIPDLFFVHFLGGIYRYFT